jgi:murein DD-endopeptidase MepM/ murein hydrolase activator NlpD
VHATADGVVTFSGTQGAYGDIVVVDHGGGYATAYAHLSRRGVRAGAQVRRGDRIGLVGRTGNATAPHLHYEVRRDGEAVNPEPYLR